MAILVRRATRDDAGILAQLNQVVQQLHLDAHPERYKVVDPNDPALIAIYEAHLADEGAHVFIAEVDGTPAGYLLAFQKPPAENPFVFGRHAFHIDQMSVNTDYQGQGVGHLLMQEAVAAAKSLDADVVTLGVVAFNEHAIRFYEKHGFTISSLRMAHHLK